MHTTKKAIIILSPFFIKYESGLFAVHGNSNFNSFFWRYQEV